ncbi:glutathione peroxidase [Leuconostoc rapi]|uniref:glutathione peroxidase n=1 Tax=Leuconostoc rapi TaxID=1406906 RepID=UPI00195AC8DE|nr:glutathione peroxidase [Leuconostoc rapi]MBM7435672.1 glutathione peroxidase [Leuconostoc rapi]
MSDDVYQFTVMTEDGKTYSLDKFRGHPMVIVNTATKCGFAPQFSDLEKIYQTYQDQGLVILGFPSNQFKQELDSSHEAAQACQLTYGVTFPMHHLIAVNGKNTDPLFKYLKKNADSPLGTTIKWNFTKFLINREGHVVKRFAPKTNPVDMIPDIKRVVDQTA